MAFFFFENRADVNYSTSIILWRLRGKMSHRTFLGTVLLVAESTGQLTFLFFFSTVSYTVARCPLPALCRGCRIHRNQLTMTYLATSLSLKNDTC